MPIPGTTKLHRLEENLEAANVHLTADDLAEIERVASAIPIEGERYPLLATTGRGCSGLGVTTGVSRTHMPPNSVDAPGSTDDLSCQRSSLRQSLRAADYVRRFPWTPSR